MKADVNTRNLSPPNLPHLSHNQKSFYIISLAPFILQRKTNSILFFLTLIFLNTKIRLSSQPRSIEDVPPIDRVPVIGYQGFRAVYRPPIK